MNELLLGRIEGVKVDEGDAVLEGAVFGLFAKDTEDFTMENALLTDTTDSEGRFAFDEVPLGDYVVVEIAAPEGYVLSDARHFVALTYSDENTVIYGHHMQSGKMFASLVNYADQSYFEEHPVVYLTTRTGKYKIELFSGYTTDRNSSAYTLRFATKHEFADWLREVSEKSDFRTSMRLSTEDHIVTLSTCAYSFYDARYVVHGRLTLVEERSGN